jgi:integrase
MIWELRRRPTTRHGLPQRNPGGTAAISASAPVMIATAVPAGRALMSMVIDMRGAVSARSPTCASRTTRPRRRRTPVRHHRRAQEREPRAPRRDWQEGEGRPQPLPHGSGSCARRPALAGIAADASAPLREGRLARTGICQMNRRCGKEIGVALNPHRFRHTFASDWLAGGGNETDLMRPTGWRSRTMLRRRSAAAATGRAPEAHRRLSPHRL